MARKGRGWQTFPIRSDLLNGLIYEAKKQHRSASNLVEHLLIESGIKEMTKDQEEQQNEVEEVLNK